MDRDGLRKLLAQVRSGKVGVDTALRKVTDLSRGDVGFATLDLQRAVRRGFPEVVYGPGKTREQILEILRRIRAAGQTVLVTRVSPEVHSFIAEHEPKVEYHEIARALVFRSGRKRKGRPGVVVVSAGTADQQPAEEASLTAELMGNQVHRIRDVGVAGIHRLLAHKEALIGARVIVAVAGMEGALPSVIAGLTECPVVGVPTSTGYGAGGRGEAALLAMLNSCSAGVTVVNIDNGFGAGYTAALINRASPRR